MFLKMYFKILLILILSSFYINAKILKITVTKESDPEKTSETIKEMLTQDPSWHMEEESGLICVCQQSHEYIQLLCDATVKAIDSEDAGNVLPEPPANQLHKPGTKASSSDPKNYNDKKVVQCKEVYMLIGETRVRVLAIQCPLSKRAREHYIIKSNEFKTIIGARELPPTVLHTRKRSDEDYKIKEIREIGLGAIMTGNVNEEVDDDEAAQMDHLKITQPETPQMMYEIAEDNKEREHCAFTHAH